MYFIWIFLHLENLGLFFTWCMKEYKSVQTFLDFHSFFKLLESHILPYCKHTESEFFSIH